MRLNFRQGIVSCQQVGPQPDFLVPSTTTGFIDLKVAPKPLVVTLAHGHSDYLLKFDATIHAAWGPLANNVVNYLYIDVNLLTGVVTHGITIHEPIISATEPPAILDQHWFDLTTTTMKVRTRDNAKWLTVARLFVGRVVGTTQLMSATVGTSANLNTPGEPGYLLYDVAGRPLRNSAGELLTDSTPVRVHGTVGTAGVLTNPINNFIPVRADEPIPAMSLVYFSGIDSVSLASSDSTLSVAKNPIGIIEQALGINEIGVITQTGEITYDNWDWSNDIGKPLYCGFHGEITTTRPVSIQAYRVGFVKNARTILFYVDAETIPQVVSQAGSLITGVPPVVATTSTNSAGEIITTVSLQAASAARNGYLSSDLFTTLSGLDPRIATAENNITTLQTSKSNVGHAHVIADTAGLQSALDGRALANHSHPEYAPVIHSHVEYALISHLHAIDDVTGLQSALDGKAAASHTHIIADVSGLQAILDGKAAASHTHAISGVTGLQSALDGKAAASHTHIITDVTGLQSALDGKAAASHTHTASTITDFSEAVDDRVSSLLIAGSNITLTYNDTANTLTIASTASGSGGISSIKANMVYDPQTGAVYQTFTPTMLTLAGNTLSTQPLIHAYNLGAGNIQLDLVNTGVMANGGLWTDGESGFINDTPATPADMHCFSFDRQFVSSYDTLGGSTLGFGQHTILVQPQLLDIQQTSGTNVITTISTFPRAQTAANNEKTTTNKLRFSKDFTVSNSGVLGEITTVALASGLSIKDAAGVERTTNVTAITIGIGLDVANVTPTEVIITARCPSVQFTM